jgi:hypothetical protein
VSGAHTLIVPGHSYAFYADPVGESDPMIIVLWFTSSTACTADELAAEALCSACSRNDSTGVISLTCPSGAVTLTPP